MTLGKKGAGKLRFPGSLTYCHGLSLYPVLEIAVRPPLQVGIAALALSRPKGQGVGGSTGSPRTGVVHRRRGSQGSIVKEVEEAPIESGLAMTLEIAIRCSA